MESTNYEKFQTGNPVVRRLIERFYERLFATIGTEPPASLLDAGCGEGETLARLDGSLPERTVAVDLSAEAVEFTRQRLPGVEVDCRCVESLPYEDRSFDLVLCLEVLEHVPEPAAAVAELARVTGGRLVVSVPHEPWFRLGSLMRGKYLRGLGNHPEHVNHWNPRSLRAFLEQQMEVVSLRGSFPWLIAECRPRPR
jgi:2-polyprenyl-3-methyl-5-hydroxy-6-metoxy-1,4-benzoquinol methylase